MTGIKVLLTATIVATCWYATLIDTAAVRSEEFLEQLQRISQDEHSENLRIERGTENGGDEKVKKICHVNMPCGWAVYVPFSRELEYFMKSTCECPDSSYKCVRVEDDLSVSAYVYRCRQNTTADDIESPEEST